jgi:hypothetical protein
MTVLAGRRLRAALRADGRRGHQKDASNEDQRQSGQKEDKRGFLVLHNFSSTKF